MLRPAIVVLLFAACSKPVSQSSAPSAIATGHAERSESAGHAEKSAPANAEIGKPAPPFTLKDTDGKEVSLDNLRGKTVVLEWFNPECPFVKKAHTAGTLVNYAKKVSAEGVVWLAINSGAPGKQGYGADTNREGIKTFQLNHPVLLDESGIVGRSYGATNTPHMFVIDAKGILVYAGAIDNSPDGEGQSPEGGLLVNHVDEALRQMREGKVIAKPSTKAYGCSVKYGH